MADLQRHFQFLRYVDQIAVDLGTHGHLDKAVINVSRNTCVRRQLDMLSRVNVAFFNINAVISFGLFAVTSIDLLLASV